MPTVEFEELENQIESRKRDIENLDDKLEEAYLETRNLKADLCKINIEKSKLVENINEGDVRIFCMNDELKNYKNRFRKLEKVNVEHEGSIFILENTLESRGLKDLKKEIISFEATVPLTFSCDECKHVVEPKKNLKDQTDIN